jgi:hypothetical protein
VTRSRLAAAVIALLLASHRPVFADGAHTSSPPHPPLVQALKGDARALYDAAHEAFKAGDYVSAYAKFQRALELSGDPRLNWNLAACERKAKHNANVLRLIDHYLKDGEGWLSDDEKKEAQRAAAAVRAFVATASVTTQPADGVDIYVDDVKVATTPTEKPIWIDTGTHRLRFAKAGLKPVERDEEIKAGAALAWSVDLEHPATPPAAPPPPAVRPATHEAPPHSSRGPLLLAGAGLAVAATGGVFVFLTTRQYSVLRDECGTSCDPARWHTQRTLQVVGDVLFGVGGAALAGGVVWWLVSGRAPSTTARVGLPGGLAF